MERAGVDALERETEVRRGGFDLKRLRFRVFECFPECFARFVECFARFVECFTRFAGCFTRFAGLAGLAGLADGVRDGRRALTLTFRCDAFNCFPLLWFVTPASGATDRPRSLRSNISVTGGTGRPLALFSDTAPDCRIPCLDGI